MHTPELYSWTEFQSTFNEALEQFVRTRKDSMEYIHTKDVVEKIIDYALHLVVHGGKRLRPYLCMTAYKLLNNGESLAGSCSGDTEKEDNKSVISLCIALELFHAFAIIHDDMIDKGVERRGVPTIHQYVQKIQKEHSRGDIVHISNAHAVLAGDLLFSWSYEIIARSSSVEVKKIFSRMIDQVLVGQMIDVSLMTETQVNLVTIETKNKLKTALYSFVNPLLMGYALAYPGVIEVDSKTETNFKTKEKASHQDILEKVGLLLGQAFQIQDDVLDIVGDPLKTGKQNFLDIEDGQHTLLTQRVFDFGTNEEVSLLKESFGKKINEDQRSSLLAMFSREAIPQAQKQVDTYILEARKIILESDLTNGSKRAFLDIIELLEKRSS